ncbi:hypothetical protein BDN70DRAFT_203020 [Pholiota conissans]|uniref:DUF6535 domain-containing protein n=1 Tax=Pholiota conissans TaxID=109636 RepID=A0A9P5YWM6_9AGAR|nr:hypothetical protein BDN70DRAFT_203020 [Pholiota conissans]
MGDSEKMTQNLRKVLSGHNSSATLSSNGASEIPSIRVEQPDDSDKEDTLSQSKISIGRRSRETSSASRGENFSHNDILGKDASSSTCENLRPWKAGEPYNYRPFTKDPWEHCRTLASKYDAEMCASWKAEVENLLIFAGLFSASVTAFTIESYKWLQPNPSSYSDQILSLIYIQLNPATGIQSLSMLSDSIPQGPTVRINIYWFLSLTLGLTTVLIGIISAQWLREYQREVSLSSKGRLALRQMRYEGLLFWQIPRIIAMLPLLLQAGFVLFLIGIAELLWMLNKTVAIVVTTFIGSVLIFLGTTIVLPALQYVFSSNELLHTPQCAFKSPQSLGFLRFVLFILRLTPHRLRIYLHQNSARFARLFNSSYHWTWSEFDIRWRELRDATSVSWGTPLDVKDSADITQALVWVVATYNEIADHLVSAFDCIQQLSLSVGIEVVRKTCGRSRSQAVEEFTNTLKDAADLTDDIKQEIATVAFLREYHELHPSLKAFYWESQIRLINSLSKTHYSNGWSPTQTQMTGLPEGMSLFNLSCLSVGNAPSRCSAATVSVLEIDCSTGRRPSCRYPENLAGRQVVNVRRGFQPRSRVRDSYGVDF